MLKKIFFLLLPLLYMACSEEPESEVTLLPDNDLFFSMYPNDPSAKDSIDANLAHGVILEVHPGAKYTLSFNRDSSDSRAPVLQLFRITLAASGDRYHASKVRSLKPRTEGRRYVYEFVCEENAMAQWATSLVDNRDFYAGKVADVEFKGDGAYSDHFSINLIVVGKVILNGNRSIKEFASEMLKRFRDTYTSVTIDTLYIREASDHPILGSRYPKDEPWMAGRSSEDLLLSELGGWPEKELKNALDIVLVHRIEEENVMGYAPLFSGNLGGGDGSTVVIGTNVWTLAGELPIDDDGIIETAVHETGHFFGLRHTTSTLADLEVSNDASIYEDGFTDTPFCRDFLRNELMKRGASRLAADYFIPRRVRRLYAEAADFVLNRCPDASNTMFPAEADVELTGLSEQQLEMLRKNLMIFPH